MSSTGFLMETDDCPQDYSKCTIEIILEGQHSHLVIDHLNSRSKGNEEDGVWVPLDEPLECFSLMQSLLSKTTGAVKVNGCGRSVFLHDRGQKIFPVI